MLKSITNLNKKNLSFDSILLINLVFGFFPLSFIFGNLITNINLVLFCVLGIFHLRSKILTTEFNLPIKIIFLLFFVIFFSTSFSFIKSLYFEGYEYIHLARLTKSILFFRYFLMLIIIYLLSKLDILNFKYFFILAAFSSILVSLDVIYQYIFGFNIIGLKGTDHHNTGFFGDEYIAGGFIQNFSFFSIFFLAFMLNDKKNLQFIFTTITICILGMGIMLSGNRVPLILFLFGLLLVFLFNDKLKKIIPVSLVCFLILFKFILSSDRPMEVLYISLYAQIKDLVIASEPVSKEVDERSTVQKEQDKEVGVIKSKYDHEADSELFFKKLNFLNDKTPQARLLLTALDTWRQNKIFGNGIKSFRVDCWKLAERSDMYLGEEPLPGFKNRLCSTHPHNYYFEILTETGIVGLFITLLIAVFFIVFILKNFKLFKENNIENFILLAATISLILEVFPFKSTGSIFTTNNATYIILISSIILSYKKTRYEQRVTEDPVSHKNN